MLRIMTGDVLRTKWGSGACAWTDEDRRNFKSATHAVDFEQTVTFIKDERSDGTYLKVLLNVGIIAYVRSCDFEKA